MQSIFAYNFNFTEIFAHAIKTPQCNWHRWFWLHGVSNTAMSSSTVSLTPRNQKLFTGTVSREFWPPFFMILSHLGLILICWSMSAYGLEFVEIFVVAKNCAIRGCKKLCNVQLTLRCQHLESKFSKVFFASFTKNVHCLFLILIQLD